ncbi:hypothetical protein FQN50_007946 [Emmonsiellopsis sp. PD_5]|nr:hypothetical protein FQN50_007946 [Emmonsiellopsis sp. PD_5]
MVRSFGSQSTGIIRNPLIDRTEHDLTQDVQRFHEVQKLGDAIDLDMLVKGAKIGRDPTRVGSLDGITDAERQILLEEIEARKRKSPVLRFPSMSALCEEFVLRIKLTMFKRLAAIGYQRQF